MCLKCLTLCVGVSVYVCVCVAVCVNNVVIIATAAPLIYWQQKGAALQLPQLLMKLCVCRA